MDKELKELEDVMKKWVSIAEEYEVIGEEYGFIINSLIEQAGDDD